MFNNITTLMTFMSSGILTLTFICYKFISPQYIKV